MSNYLVEWTRYDKTEGGAYAEAYVAEMTAEQALEIHDEVGARDDEDLTVNEVEILDYREIRKLVGLR